VTEQKMKMVLAPVKMALAPVEDSSAGLRSLAETAADDLLRGFRRRELWGRLGWLDVKRRYRRTMIGPFWNAITLAVYVLTVGTGEFAKKFPRIYRNCDPEPGLLAKKP
jgi:hypothetical protein